MKTLKVFQEGELQYGSLIKVRQLFLEYFCTNFIYFVLNNHSPSTGHHRNIVRYPVLMRELWLQMWHDIHPDTKTKFVTKGTILYQLHFLYLYSSI